MDITSTQHEDRFDKTTNLSLLQILLPFFFSLTKITPLKRQAMKNGAFTQRGIRGVAAVGRMRKTMCFFNTKSTSTFSTRRREQKAQTWKRTSHRPPSEATVDRMQDTL